MINFEAIQHIWKTLLPVPYQKKSSWVALIGSEYHPCAVKIVLTTLHQCLGITKTRFLNSLHVTDDVEAREHYVRIFMELYPLQLDLIPPPTTTIPQRATRSQQQRTSVVQSGLDNTMAYDSWLNETLLVRLYPFMTSSDKLIVWQFNYHQVQNFIHARNQQGKLILQPIPPGFEDEPVLQKLLTPTSVVSCIQWMGYYGLTHVYKTIISGLGQHLHQFNHAHQPTHHFNVAVACARVLHNWLEVLERTLCSTDGPKLRHTRHRRCLTFPAEISAESLAHEMLLVALTDHSHVALQEMQALLQVTFRCHVELQKLVDMLALEPDPDRSWDYVVSSGDRMWLFQWSKTFRCC